MVMMVGLWQKILITTTITAISWISQDFTLAILCKAA